MGAGVVTVGRRVYAAGLYWENSPIGRVVQAAREAANQPGQQAEFYAVRAGNKDGRVPQFGLGQAGAGHKSNMPAFAGCIANQQGGSWAGAFRLREGIVLTVVRDDLIVPDGDQLFANETEARERLLQEIGFGGLQRCYAPDAWSIPGADSMPISLLLNERRDIRLRPVNIPKKQIMIGAGVVGVLVLGLAIGWYIQEKKAEEAAAEMARLQALQRAREKAAGMVPGALRNVNPEYPLPERKWEKAPAPLDVVEVCRNGLAQVPAAVAGWHLTTLKCDGKGLALGWAHDKGIAGLPMPDVTISVDGANATLTMPLVAPPDRAPENLMDPTDITRRYLAQGWAATLAGLPDDPPPPPPPGFSGGWNPPLVPWIKRSFTVTVPELPGEIASDFDGVPGVVITGLTYNSGNNAGGTWTIQGVIYENRI